MPKVCICQICNCGRHRCPHHPGKVLPKGDGPCLLSEYANKYHSHPIKPREAFKPKEESHKNAGPLEDRTTHRVDYIPHPLEKPHVHMPDEYVQPEGNFDHLTSYKKEYTKKPIKPSGAIKKDTTRKTPGKFSGEPTYTSDYRKWDLEKRQPIINDGAYEPNDAPFEGTPTYVRDYIRHKEEPRQSMKPAETARMSDQPFDGRTGYRDDYVKHPLAQKEKREKQIWAPNKAPLDSLSNYRKDYTEKSVPPGQSCKPDATPYQSQARFDGDTTHKSDYLKWAVDRPYVHEPEVYHKPEGDFDWHTTTRQDFTKKPLFKMVAKRPSSRRRSAGKFNGTTNYKDDYRKWQLKDRLRPQMKSDYAPNSAPFEGQPTYTSDYIRHAINPQQSMKPVENARMSDQPFDGDTCYRQYFTKHPVPPKEVREKETYNPNKAPLDDLSNYRKDYTEKKAPKMASCKPDPNPYNSGAPFNSDTTNRLDYTQWPTTRPVLHEPDQWVRPEGDFDFNTTHHTDFTKKPMKPRSAKRPDGGRREPGKFDGITNYTTDYRQWDPSCRPQVTQRTDYRPPSAPFEGQSTFQEHYIRHKTMPAQSMKPADRGYASDAPLDANTMYRSDYTKKSLPPCPAAILDTGSSRFVFKELSHGHKWYAPVSESVIGIPNANMDATLNRQLTALSVA